MNYFARVGTLTVKGIRDISVMMVLHQAYFSIILFWDLMDWPYNALSG